MSTTAKGKAKEKPLASLLAGATAGGIESFVTFPLESLKTQLQFGALDGSKVSHYSSYSVCLPVWWPAICT
jgi:solute carrier family 25 citrate transporter 1